MFPASGQEPADDGATERITVFGKPSTETQPLGPNRQAEWTTRRRFSNADVYVHPPWQVEVSAGWVAREPDEGDTLHQFLQEIEIGLPYRLQLDLELAEEVAGGDGEFSNVGVEMRWAVAEWGQLLMNPAIYGEWEFHPDEADEFEIKFLLGETAAPRVFVAANFFYERQIGGEEEQEFAVSTALSYSLIDRVLGVGAEMRFTLEDEEDENEVLFAVGPSLSWRITEDFSLVAAPLFGVTEKSPVVESFVFLRYYFDATGEDYQGNWQTPSMEAR